MDSAVVNTATGVVENLIVADPAVDAAPDGYTLVGDPPDGIVLFSSTWDGTAFGNLQVPASVGVSPVNGVETL